MIAHAVARFGRLDCPFNNAGTISSSAELADIDFNQFDAAIAMHVRSVLACISLERPS